MPPVREFRIALTVADLDATTALYRDAFGLDLIESWDGEDGRGALLRLPPATLELLDVDQSHVVDELEVGRRLGHRIRFAVEVDDVVAAAREVTDAGARPVATVTKSPSGHTNLRVETADGMQLTLFQTSG